MIAAWAFLFRLFDKDKVQLYYTEDQVPRRDLEIVDIASIRNRVAQYRRGPEIIEIHAPNPTLVLEPRENVLKGVQNWSKKKKTKTKDKKSLYQVLAEESKDTVEEPEEHSGVFTWYKTENGFKPNKIIDFRKPKPYDLETGKMIIDETLPRDLYLDCYEHNRWISIETGHNLLVPLALLDPEYFVKPNPDEVKLKSGGDIMLGQQFSHMRLITN